jgi:hypothetical protein
MSSLQRRRAQGQGSDCTRRRDRTAVRDSVGSLAKVRHDERLVINFTDAIPFAPRHFSGFHTSVRLFWIATTRRHFLLDNFPHSRIGGRQVGETRNAPTIGSPPAMYCPAIRAPRALRLRRMDGMACGAARVSGKTFQGRPSDVPHCRQSLVRSAERYGMVAVVRSVC